ncbi:MAG: ATP-dependent Clp protease adaptor ClpS [Chloroflexi bacterium]|jgi:ATP-dependent Clp protease adaptor protein ClpS|nr:ATP-dependent Clp protease adaptor ClpS [Chloroflexota bacterium]
MPDTQTVPDLQLNEELLQKLLPPFHVILHNDDVHTFDDVARALNKVIGVSLKRGYELADIVHNQGKAVVATCRKEQAELYRERLEGYKLTVTIEPAD